MTGAISLVMAIALDLLRINFRRKRRSGISRELHPATGSRRPALAAEGPGHKGAGLREFPREECRLAESGHNRPQTQWPDHHKVRQVSKL